MFFSVSVLKRVVHCSILNIFRSLDRNHLISVGDEGMRTNGNRQEPHSWLNNGYDGVSAECNWADPNIDVATLHTYPDQ